MHAALHAQEERIQHHDEQLSEVGRGMRELTQHHDSFQSSICNQDGPQQSIPTPGGPPGLCLALLACCFCYCLSSTITAKAPASALVFPSASVPHLAKPEWFLGASGKCRAFLVQCGLHFELQASSFPTKQAKGAFMITQLSGRSKAWVTAEWARNSSVRHSLTLFSGWTGGWAWTGHHRPSLEASA